MTHETRCNLIDALTAAGSTRSNYDIARQFGCDVSTVRAYRLSLGVPIFARKLYDWSGADLSKTAAEVAADVGCSVHAVHARRSRVRGPWTAEQDAAILSRAKPDAELAADFGRTKAAIRHHRWKLRSDGTKNTTDQQPSSSIFVAMIGHRIGCLPSRVYTPIYRWAVSVVRMLERRGAYGVPRGKRAEFSLTFVGGTTDVLSLYYQKAPVTIWVSFTLRGERVQMPLQAEWVKASEDEILSAWNATEPERQRGRQEDLAIYREMTARIMRGQDP